MRVDVYDGEIAAGCLIESGADTADLLPEPDDHAEALRDLLAAGRAAIGGGAAPLVFLVPTAGSPTWRR